MKKPIQKVITLVLAVFMALSFVGMAACTNRTPAATTTPSTGDDNKKDEAAPPDDIAPPPEETTEGQAEDETINLVYMTGVSPETLNQLLERYKTIAPNVEFTIIQMPPGGEENLAKFDGAVASGQQIDLFDVGGGTGVSRPRAFSGTILPLDEYIENAGIDMEKTFVPGSDFTCAFVFGDEESRHWYTLPMSLTLYPVYYNKTMFDAANIPAPSDDWTFEDLRSVAKQLTSGSGVNKVFGSWIPVDWGWFAGVPAQLAGWEAYREEDGKRFANFDDERLIKTIEMYYNMSVVDESNPSATEINVSKLDMVDYFVAGQSAMIVGNAWCFFDLQKAKALGEMDFELGIVVLPRVVSGISKDVTAGEIGGGMSIPKTTAHPNEAFQFMLFCALDCADIYRALPASSEADMDAVLGYLGSYFDEDGKKYENLFTREELDYYMRENREGFKSYYQMKEDEYIGPLWVVLATEVNNVMTDAKTIDQAIADMMIEGQKEIDKLEASQ